MKTSTPAAPPLALRLPLDLTYWTKGRKLRYLVKELSEDNIRGAVHSGRAGLSDGIKDGIDGTIVDGIDGIKGSNGGRMSLNSFQAITAPDKMMDLASLWLLNQFPSFMGNCLYMETSKDTARVFLPRTPRKEIS